VDFNQGIEVIDRRLLWEAKRLSKFVRMNMRLATKLKMESSFLFRGLPQAQSRRRRRVGV
jgi:hypothetical protein